MKITTLTNRVSLVTRIDGTADYIVNGLPDDNGFSFTTTFPDSPEGLRSALAHGARLNTLALLSAAESV